MDAIKPSIAIPEYSFEKSLDAFNSTLIESNTPAQNAAVWDCIDNRRLK